MTARKRRDAHSFAAVAIWAAAVEIVLFFLRNWGYFTFFEAFWGGCTPGKRIVRLNAAGRDGVAHETPAAFAQALDRSLDTRRALAQRMAAALQAQSGLEPPPPTSVEIFLEATARPLRDVSRLQ